MRQWVQITVASAPGHPAQVMERDLNSGLLAAALAPNHELYLTCAMGGSWLEWLSVHYSRLLASTHGDW